VLAAQGRRLVVPELAEVKEDMVEVLTSFCARVYGRRSAWNLTKKAIEAIRQ
jgi:predicted site-specific integrase-resolvase